MILLVIMSISFIFNAQDSFGVTDDPIMITYSDKMNFIEFDGRWTSFSEWKESSLNSIGSAVQIRSAHFGNFIYIFVDALYDSSLDKGSDRAIICFDFDNTKSFIPDDGDFCFVSILDRETGFTLQGNSPFSSKSNFQQIPNHPDFIAIGAVSDENDRYSKSPHPSYEFKIPTDLIQRSNNYGFYVETFDAHSGKSLTWPQNIDKNNPTGIPTPNNWGELISIDKSLPEFPSSIILLVVILLAIITISRNLNNGRLRINIQ